MNRTLEISACATRAVAEVTACGSRSTPTTSPSRPTSRAARMETSPAPEPNPAPASQYQALPRERRARSADRTAWLGSRVAVAHARGPYCDVFMDYSSVGALGPDPDAKSEASSNVAPTVLVGVPRRDRRETSIVQVNAMCFREAG